MRRSSSVTLKKSSRALNPRPTKRNFWTRLKRFVSKHKISVIGGAALMMLLIKNGMEVHMVNKLMNNIDLDEEFGSLYSKVAGGGSLNSHELKYVKSNLQQYKKLTETSARNYEKMKDDPKIPPSQLESMREGIENGTTILKVLGDCIRST